MTRRSNVYVGATVVTLGGPPHSRPADAADQDHRAGDPGRRIPSGPDVAEAVAESLGFRIGCWSRRRFPRSRLGRSSRQGDDRPESWRHDELSTSGTSRWRPSAGTPTQALSPNSVARRRRRSSNLTPKETWSGIGARQAQATSGRLPCTASRWMGRTTCGWPVITGTPF